MEAPLLGGDAVAVACRGTPGTLVLAPGGTVAYVPSADAPTYCWGLSRRWHLQRQEIPGDLIVGAALESPTTLRIWYCQDRTVLRRTPRLVCQSGQEAARVVAAVRAACCGWSRGRGPLRVVAIVEPSAMRVFARVVAPVLECAAGFELAVAPATGPGAAAAAAARVDPSAVDALLIAGPDGALLEALHGLLSRPDWREASARLVLAHVPVPRSRLRLPAALPPWWPSFGSHGAAAAAAREARSGGLLCGLLGRLGRLYEASGGSGSGEGGVRLARAAGLSGATTAVWALVKGSVARRDVASVMQPPAWRRFALLSANTRTPILDLAVGRRAPLCDVAWRPVPAPAPVAPPSPIPSAAAAGPPRSPSPALPCALAPVGGPGAPQNASGEGEEPAAAHEGPPLPLVRPFLEGRCGPRVGPAGVATMALPPGWASRLQVPTRGITLHLAAPQPAAAPAVAAPGPSGSAPAVLPLPSPVSPPSNVVPPAGVARVVVSLAGPSGRGRGSGGALAENVTAFVVAPLRSDPSPAALPPLEIDGRPAPPGPHRATPTFIEVHPGLVATTHCPPAAVAAFARSRRRTSRAPV